MGQLKPCAGTALRERSRICFFRSLFGGKTLGLPVREALAVPIDVRVAALHREGRCLEALPAFRTVAVDDDGGVLRGRQLRQVELVLARVEGDGLVALLAIGDAEGALYMAFGVFRGDA